MENSKSNKLILSTIHIIFLRVFSILLFAYGFVLLNRTNNFKEFILEFIIFIVFLVYYIKAERIYHHILNVFTKLKYFLESESNINFDRLSILINNKKFQNNDTKLIFSKLNNSISDISRKVNDLNYYLNEDSQNDNQLVLSIIDELIEFLNQINEYGLLDVYKDNYYWFPEYRTALKVDELFKQRIKIKLDQLYELKLKYQDNN